MGISRAPCCLCLVARRDGCRKALFWTSKERVLHAAWLPVGTRFNTLYLRSGFAAAALRLLPHQRTVPAGRAKRAGLRAPHLLTTAAFQNFAIAMYFSVLFAVYRWDVAEAATAFGAACARRTRRTPAISSNASWRSGYPIIICLLRVAWTGVRCAAVLRVLPRFGR